MVSFEYRPLKEALSPHLLTLKKPVPAMSSLPTCIGEHAAFNVYDRGCPARVVFDRLADKWALLVLRRLCGGGRLRFNQLRREVDGISQKVLSQTLKKLERDGIIHREVFPTVPATVEYSLTALGKTLSDTIEHLSRWAELNMHAIELAQQRYDERMAQLVN
jgi:DNA-binding HxlR family transcriptional regulator